MLASMASPASELSTTSTPPISSRIASRKAVLRELWTFSAPNNSTSARLSGELTVAAIRAPRRRAICIAASPTPPAAPWISTHSPG
jgi:hypothetical protein